MLDNVNGLLSMRVGLDTVKHPPQAGVVTAESAQDAVEDRARPAAAPRPPDVRAALIDSARQELGRHGAAGVSLRAVARRAGVSHAAPKHHFGDRAGLLTALAVDGHRQLAARLRGAATGGTADAPDDPTGRIAALARAYLAFGFDEPALFELMFRPDQLHRDDPDLVEAGRGSFGVLVDAVDDAARGRAVREHPDGGRPPRDVALIAWAFVHGLVVLVRDGVLDSAGATASADPRDLASSLTDTFTAILRARATP
jgi:AcrR family transcriptional regulator